MSQDEIDKLRAKVERDPDSKLFLPLAEEYRKQGMLSEALDVLLNGLDRQPGYTSARVTLGKVYLEMNMPNDARVEFERVIDAVPDNLFVHRKLAELYRQDGETDKAVMEYRKVLELNPYDEDAKSFLDLLEGSKPVDEYTATTAYSGPAVEAPVYTEGHYVRSGTEETNVAASEPLSEAGPAKEDMSGHFEKEFEDLKDFLNDEETISDAEEDVFPEEGTGAEAGADSETESSPLTPSPVGEPEKETYEPAEAHAGDLSGMPDYGGAERHQGINDFSYADSMIIHGDYYNAIKTYNEMLSGDPENRHIQQRLAELKAYLELTGEGYEILISRLSLFLEEARKRRTP